MGYSDLRNVTYPYPGFRGLNLKDGPLTVPPQFSRKANFINFGLLGTIEKAPAPLRINSVQFPGNPRVLGLVEYVKPDLNRFFIAYTDEPKFYKIDVNGVSTDITPTNVSIAPDIVNPHWFVYNGLLWFGDGVNRPIYVHDAVDANSWYNIGLDIPTAAMGGTPGVVGVLNGNYKYKFRYVSSSGARSNLSPEMTNPVSPVNQVVDLAGILVNPNANENTISREVFRTLSDGVVYYFHSTISDNTTTTLQDNKPDEELGERGFEEKEIPPPGLQGFVEYNNSVYGFIPRTHDLRFSNTSDPEAFGAFNIEPITPGDGYPITGLSVLNNLVIFKEKSIHNWVGFPGYFRRTRKVTGHGAVSHNSIRPVDLPSGGDVLVYLSQYGPRFYDEQDSFLLGREIEPIFTLQDPNYKFNHGRAFQASAEYSQEDRRYFLSIPVNGSSDNNLLLVYDVYANSWSYREPLYCGQISSRTNSDAREEIVGSDPRDDVANGGYVFTIEGADDHFGQDYLGEYTTVWDHFGFPHHVKLYKSIEIDAETSGEFDIFVDIYIDGEEVPRFTYAFKPSEQGSVWDAAIWDTSTFAVDNFLTFIRTVRRLQGRFISLGFRTPGQNQRFKVLQARVKYALLPTAGDRR